jgi:hypothetical protein
MSVPVIRYPLVYSAVLQDARSAVDPKDCALIIGITYFISAILSLILKERPLICPLSDERDSVARFFASGFFRNHIFSQGSYNNFRVISNFSLTPAANTRSKIKVFTVYTLELEGKDLSIC